MVFGLGFPPFLGGMLSFYCNTHYCTVVSPSVCRVVHPTKAIGWGEVPFGRDTRVVPNNNVLHRALVSVGRIDLGSKPPVCSDTA